MYGRAKRRSGLTLIEMTVVIGAIVILVGFGLPAVRTLMHSFESSGGTRSMIGAALNSARSMAVKEQRYAGVRFQPRCVSGDPADPISGLLDAPQYMIFIVHDTDMSGLADGFRAMDGAEPVKLPHTIGVMDLTARGTADYNDISELNDALTFSIVFSPSGKLTVHQVQTRNRDGVYNPADAGKSSDEVFNSPKNIITYNTGMFVQDDYPAAGFEKEPSRLQFVLYDRQRLRAAFNKGDVWDDYLSVLTDEDTIYISPHTGALISSD